MGKLKRICFDSNCSDVSLTIEEINELIETALEGYATEQYVQDYVSSLDAREEEY